MMHKFSRPVALLVLSSFSLLSTGCYEHIGIRPSELPKMNGAFVTSQSTGSNSVLVTQSVVHVEKEDGRIEEIKGEYDIIVTNSVGNKFKFQHPIIVESLPDGYLIKGANRSPETFKVREIKKVEVVRPGGVGFTIGYVLGPVLVLALITTVVLSLPSSN